MCSMTQGAVMSGATFDWTDATRQAMRAHALLESSTDINELPLRSDVRESWKRSLAASALTSQTPTFLSEDHLRLARERSQLHRTWPVFEKLLVPAATEANLLVALADTQGRLLWIAGGHTARNSADSAGFVEGADWSERSMGTTAPGMALATGAGAQVSEAEHIHELAHRFSCSAVPIRNPRTGQVIGAIDLTGGPEAVALHSLPLLQAAVMAAETQLLLPAAGAVVDPDYLDLVSAEGARLGETPLSLRHAEILTLLSEHPEGLSSAELVDLLFERPDAAAEGTVRAEIVRIRKVLAGLPGHELQSRPYRLPWALQTTLGRLREYLERGDLEHAVQLYSPNILTRSQAPGINEVKSRVFAAMRELLLDAGSAQQLVHVGRQAGDVQLLRASLRELPADSPARSIVVAEVQQLEA